MACMPCTATGSHAAWDVADKSALEEEREGGVAEDCGYIGEEGGTLGAVGEPMVEGDRQGRHPARFNPLVRSIAHHPGPASDLADAQDAGLLRVENRGTRVHTEHADVGDRERAARQVRRLSLGLARR